MDSLVHDNPVITSLAGCHLFKMVEWCTIQDLAKTAKLSRFDRGQRVCSTGDAEFSLFLVKSGQVKLSILASNGSERVIEVLSAGGTFGEEALFSALPSRVHAEMLTKGEVIEIPGISFRERFKNCPMLASSLLKHLSRKVCRYVGELENCCLRSARQRVVDYLLTLASEQMPGEEHRLTLMLPAGKGVIASLLDITPETFSRELNRLNCMELIRVERKSIDIFDLRRLRSAGDR